MSFGLVIGLAVGMLGGGSSVLAVPVLVYVLGQNAHEATTASLVIVVAGALAGGVAHAREGRVCWRHAAAFTAAGLPGVVAGSALGDEVSGGALIAAFVAIMLVAAAAAATWRTAGAGAGDHTAGVGRESTCPPVRLACDLTAGLLIGAMTGFFGVGGGFLVVPTLAVILTISMRLAVGTSLAIIGTTSLMGLAAHLAAGRSVDVGVTTAMAAACVAGAVAGARLAGRVPQRRLGRGFAAVLTAVAAYLLVAAMFLGGPPGSA